MLDEGVGKLHKWTKEEDVTGGMAVQWDEKRKQYITNANEVLETRRGEWADVWELFPIPWG